MNEGTCGNCGYDRGLSYYDGALGYEALICPECKAVHDHQGLWVNNVLIKKAEDFDEPQTSSENCNNG